MCWHFPWMSSARVRGRGSRPNSSEMSCCARTWPSGKPRRRVTSYQDELNLLCTHGIFISSDTTTTNLRMSARCSVCRHSSSPSGSRVPAKNVPPKGSDEPVMTSGDFALIAVAIVLVVVAAFLAGADAAFSRVSRVAVDEFVRQGRRGSHRLQLVVADPARYVNVALFLRALAEITAIVLVTVVALNVFAARMGSGAGFQRHDGRRRRMSSSESHLARWGANTPGALHWLPQHLRLRLGHFSLAAYQATDSARQCAHPWAWFS